jgi:hypothetical protein
VSRPHRNPGPSGQTRYAVVDCCVSRHRKPISQLHVWKGLKSREGWEFFLSGYVIIALSCSRETYFRTIRTRGTAHSNTPTETSRISWLRRRIGRHHLERAMERHEHRGFLHAINLVILSSLAGLFSDNFPRLKSRVVTELFLFLCGVMIGALGSYFLQAGDLDQNSRHLLTRVPLLAGNAD